MKKIITLLALLALLALHGCVDLNSYDLNRFIEGCQSKGGIHRIYNDLVVYRAVCNDGSYVE